MTARRLLHLVAARKPDWLSMAQVAALDGRPSGEAARKFCRRHKQHLDLMYRGRRLFVERGSLEQWHATRTVELGVDGADGNRRVRGGERPRTG